MSSLIGLRRASLGSCSHDPFLVRPGSRHWLAQQLTRPPSASTPTSQRSGLRSNKSLERWQLSPNSPLTEAVPTTVVSEATLTSQGQVQIASAAADITRQRGRNPSLPRKTQVAGSLDWNPPSLHCNRLDLGLEQSHFDQVTPHDIGRFFRRLAAGIDPNFWRLRSFVGIGDSREILDLAGQRLLVEAFDVAFN